ncbi:MAG: hypothetical protein IT317_01270, partial [Anaerolineales bacterium]|nr:hypothetical protein [Anaerolineales bacterium]
MSKFIIIRGPSGAGKSTVAKALMDLVTKTTALIERDYYMFMFMPDDGSVVPDKELIENNILTCLDRGIDVIFEGNFRVMTHKQLLDRIFAVHPDENYMFYLIHLQISLNRLLPTRFGIIWLSRAKGAKPMSSSRELYTRVIHTLSPLVSV